MRRLENKVAIVTGSGIGEATARLMAREGASMVVADINGTEAERVVANSLALWPPRSTSRTSRASCVDAIGGTRKLCGSIWPVWRREQQRLLQPR